MSGAFERFIGIDWSGAEKPRAQNVFVADVERCGGRISFTGVTRASDREAVESFLAGDELLTRHGWEEWGVKRLDSRRTLVGLDFAFGFPVSFVHPSRRTRWNWHHLAALAEELDRRQSLRAAIEEDEALRSQFDFEGTGSRRVPRKTDTALAAAGDHGKPKPRGESVFHLVGPSQVGLGSIRGIAVLQRLRKRHAVRVWPFDEVGEGALVLVEVFPRRWLEPGLRKNEFPDRFRQLDAWKRRGIALSTEAQTIAAASPDALDAAAAAIGLAEDHAEGPASRPLPPDALREGWIVGVPAGR